MEIPLNREDLKEDVFAKVSSYLGDLAINTSEVDAERPWGGFFRVADESVETFITKYFPDYDRNQIEQFGGKLEPKILVVAPGQMLSWQYHDRRAELWKGVQGPVGYIRSADDVQGEVQTLENGQTVQFDPEERHRLVGLSEWGLVAEIWQHTDPQNPSDENDIVRLQDNYGR